MKIIETKHHHITTYLVTALLIISDYAFNDQKGLLYSVKIAFIGFMLLRYIINNEKLTKYTLWATIFITYSGSSILWAYSQNDALFNFIWLFQVLIITICLDSFIKEKNDLEFLINCFIVGGIVLVIRIIIQTPISHWGVLRLGSMINYNENDIALRLIFSFVGCLYYITKRTTRRKLMLILMTLFILVIFFTGSKKGFLGIIMAVIVNRFMLVKSANKFFKNIVVVLIIAIGGYYIVMNTSYLYNVLGYRIEDMIRTLQGESLASHSTFLRLQMIVTGFELFTHRPLLGYGLGNYAVLSGFEAYSHNNYIELLVNVGIVGLFIYYQIYFAIFKKLFKLIPRKDIHLIYPAVVLALIVAFEFAMVSYRIMYFHILIVMCYNWLIIIESDPNNKKKSVKNRMIKHD